MSRTSLTRYAPTFRDIDPDGARKASAAAWHRYGTVSVPADVLKTLPWQDQDLLRKIAAKLYGKREGDA